MPRSVSQFSVSQQSRRAGISRTTENAATLGIDRGVVRPGGDDAVFAPIITAAIPDEAGEMETSKRASRHDWC
ncbi:hypothetical protein N7492_006055 [Penicillium capsulatum]|uniref:Uncharacterized protein n=1 Tax=Penicillium capsulatum TaxID=69766 RepID=A0A9W9LLC1_9EURO|nr:hypothetical protein N7492_006055 [Penicillium capsulatum]KAJ6108705.1 hypothetical protein N7512_008542 [Penicillium capsulatum]KAJ6113199.1 hypothetical protein N7512_008523 [Penicillium capsulatum]